MEETSLTKTAKLIKSEKYLLLFGFFALLLFIFYALSKIPIGSSGAAYKNNVVPGETTKEDLIAKLGSPEKTQTVGSTDIYTYPSTNQFRKDTVGINSTGTVSIVKEQVITNEKGTLRAYTQKYGKEEALLYGPHSTFAPGYFWGEDGIMVFANSNDGTILEIWYFPPQQLEAFLKDNPTVTANPEKHEEH